MHAAAGHRDRGSSTGVWRWQRRSLTEDGRIDNGAASAVQLDERADALDPELPEPSCAALPLLLVNRLHRVALQAWEEQTHCSSEAGQRRW